MRGAAAVERENADRGVFVTSEITFDTYATLAPQITRLRLKSQHPICFFIHSPGGDPDAAELLLRLARVPHQSGGRCQVTTVNVGFAASAAADLLSAGDYAIAYGDSIIHVHGVRTKHSELTVELTREVEKSLSLHNEYFATKLANRMFRRLLTQALLFEVFKTVPPVSNVIAVSADPRTIWQRIHATVDDDHKKLLSDAWDRMDRVRRLVDYVEQTETVSVDALSKDGHLLKSLIDFELAALRDQKVERLLPDHVELIREDFLILKDFLDGGYWKQSIGLAHQKGHYFLKPDELDEYRLLKEREESNKYLESKATGRIFPLWYLVVSLCRLLQYGEHSFTAKDAWMFGLIDEVPGSDLPSTRLWKELRNTANTPVPSATSASSPSALQPPSSQSPPETSPKEP